MAAEGADVHQEETGILGESTAYRDSKVPDRHMATIRQSLRVNLLRDEELLGLFAAYRFSRAITVLVVTDRRLLTLGSPETGMPVVDEVFRSAVTSLHVEREKLLSSGKVVAQTQAGPVHLGTLDYKADGSTFLGLDEVMARAPRPGGMPVIPVPGQRAALVGVDDGTPVSPPLPGDGPGAPAQAGGTHPLVAHLTALADLHERGALTDEEFVAAKARLLESPEG